MTGEKITAVLGRVGHVVLAVVALCGVVLSWSSLYAAAVPTFGPWLAAGFPLLVDALAAGASLQYVAGARRGRPRAGWRLTAHAAIAGTVALNALAAHSAGAVPWHVTAPAVWAVLVELYGREALGQWRAEHVETISIPGRLWLTAPIESARTWLRMGRTGVAEHALARLDVGVHAAAVEALRLALPGGDGRRVRRVLGRQLRAGSMPPVAVLAAIGWGGDDTVLCTPQGVLRAALHGVLTPDGDVPEPVAAEATVATAEPVAPPVSIETPESIEVPTSAPAVRPVRVAAARSSRSQVTAKAARTDAELRAELGAAIEAGQLPPAPSAEAIRTTLRVAPPRARTLRDGLRTT